MGRSKLSKKEDLREAVKKSLSLAQVLRHFGLRPVGGNYKTLNNYIRQYKIDISHFTGKGWNVGSRYRNLKKKEPITNILIKNRPFSSYHLKRRLFNEGYKKKICECCGLSMWNGKPIPLELNHINGDNVDNRIENLEIICPNCHAQTPHYRGKSKKKK
jgi:hypothetical protein